MFFDGWYKLSSIFIVGFLAYAAVVVLLRVSGKRTLSKWNAFDFIVTVALGSILATVVTSKDTVLFEGVAALALLTGLQFVITWLSVRWKALRKTIKSTPSLVFDRGEFRRDAMRRERVGEEEVRMAIRAEGVGATEEIEAVVLETDGSFSVIKKSAAGSRSALSDVS